jgi:hypothetical protein
MPGEREHEPLTAVPTTREELLTITLEPSHSRSHMGSSARTTLDTSDPDDARTFRLLREADASGAFGPHGFQNCQLGPELYTIAFYPGGALDLLERKQPVSGGRGTT